MKGRLHKHSSPKSSKKWTTEGIAEALSPTFINSRGEVLDMEACAGESRTRAERRETSKRARCVKLRDELDAVGVVVMDRADGVTWRVKV